MFHSPFTLAPLTVEERGPQSEPRPGLHPQGCPCATEGAARDSGTRIWKHPRSRMQGCGQAQTSDQAVKGVCAFRVHVCVNICQDRAAHQPPAVRTPLEKAQLATWALDCTARLVLLLNLLFPLPADCKPSGRPAPGHPLEASRTQGGLHPACAAGPSLPASCHRVRTRHGTTVLVPTTASPTPAPSTKPSCSSPVPSAPHVPSCPGQRDDSSLLISPCHQPSHCGTRFLRTPLPARREGLQGRSSSRWPCREPARWPHTLHVDSAGLPPATGPPRRTRLCRAILCSSGAERRPCWTEFSRVRPSHHSAPQHHARPALMR